MLCNIVRLNKLAEGGFRLHEERSYCFCHGVIISATFRATADFSYTTTRKTTGGAMAAMAGNAA